MKTQTAKKVKHALILARYFAKKTGIVHYSVLSSNGIDAYCTTLNAQDKAISCSCPATVRCYHMRDCENREAARATCTGDGCLA